MLRTWFVRQSVRWLLLAGTALLPAVGLAQTYVVPAPEAPTLVWAGDEEFGATAYLGVQLEEETEHAEGGARITEVVADSPAERAGLSVGDIVIRFDGKTIRGPVGLTRQIHAKEPGDKVAVTVVRQGRKRSFDVELADRAEWSRGFTVDVGPLAELKLVTPRLGDKLRSLEGLSFELPQALHCDDGKCDVAPLVWGGGPPRLGVQLVETTPELRVHLGGHESAGVLVSKVLRGTPAEHGGIRVGDLIVAVDGVEVAGSADLRRALRERAGQTFDIEIVRENRRTSVQVTLPAAEDELPSGPRAAVVPHPAPTVFPAASTAQVPAAQPTPAPPVPRAAPSPAPRAAPRAPRPPASAPRPAAVPHGVPPAPAPSNVRPPTAPVAPQPPSLDRLGCSV